MLPAIIPILAPIIGDIVKDVAGRIGVDQDRLKELDAKIIEQQLALRLEETKAASEIEQAYLKDRQSARDLTMTLARTSSSVVWATPIISSIVIIGFVAMLSIILFVDIPTGSRDVAFLMLGTLGSSFASVIQYWMGSSRGSDKKTDLLAAAPPVGNPAPSMPDPIVEDLPPPRRS